MLSLKEIEHLIYKDAAHTIENPGWLEQFYELWLERYHALNIVKSPEQVIRPGRELILALLRDYRFDEIHLFKIHDGANVYALLQDKGEGNWSYQFVVIYKDQPEKVIQCCQDVEELKVFFDHKEPILEIPLPNDRKYVED
ncbi:hypothetical protein [Taibaiella koreensis]|uniref:hypothetical protein n=1 Tax=Taibaiella koreensis TaxID=1268548 RepID=UPI000E59E826|nr:hypothetical protein [Taibaiella koreensis]